MNQLEQIAVTAIVTLFGVLAVYIKYLVGEKRRSENKAMDETFKRIKLEVKNEVRDKSNADLVDEANKRYGG